MPRAPLASAKRLITKMATIAIGASVRIGATAIFTPSRIPYRRLWAMTSVVMGPGENPPASPTTIPVRRYGQPSLIDGLQRMRFALGLFGSSNVAIRYYCV